MHRLGSACLALILVQTNQLGSDLPQNRPGIAKSSGLVNDFTSYLFMNLKLQAGDVQTVAFMEVRLAPTLAIDLDAIQTVHVDNVPAVVRKNETTVLATHVRIGQAQIDQRVPTDQHFSLPELQLNRLGR
jgi:hypothetical protein